MKKHIFLFIPVFLFILSSCVKEDPTIAIVNVVDTNNEPVPDAMVVLYGNPMPPLGEVIRFDTAYTDQNGQAVYDYTEMFKLGQAGFAILEIRAKKGALEGNETIRIEEEKTNTIKVRIEP